MIDGTTCLRQQIMPRADKIQVHAGVAAHGAPQWGKSRRAYLGDGQQADRQRGTLARTSRAG